MKKVFMMIGLVGAMFSSHAVHKDLCDETFIVHPSLVEEFLETRGLRLNGLPFEFYWRQISLKLEGILEEKNKEALEKLEDEALSKSCLLEIVEEIPDVLRSFYKQISEIIKFAIEHELPKKNANYWESSPDSSMFSVLNMLSLVDLSRLNNAAFSNEKLFQKKALTVTDDVQSFKYEGTDAVVGRKLAKKILLGLKDMLINGYFSWNAFKENYKKGSTQVMPKLYIQIQRTKHGKKVTVKSAPCFDMSLYEDESPSKLGTMVGAVATTWMIALGAFATYIKCAGY